MNKKAFDRGFVKAAMANGASPLEAVQLLKLAAFDLETSLSALKGAVPQSLDQATPALEGAGIGALGGALGGAAIDHKHRVRGAVGGGLAGGLAGLVGGGLYSGNKGFNVEKQKILDAYTHRDTELSQARAAAIPKASNIPGVDWYKNLIGIGPTQNDIADLIDPQLATDHTEAMNVGHSSYLKALLGQKNPDTTNILGLLNLNNSDRANILQKLKASTGQQNPPTP
jgi:hypothetical protein